MRSINIRLIRFRERPQSKISTEDFRNIKFNLKGRENSGRKRKEKLKKNKRELEGNKRELEENKRESD